MAYNSPRDHGADENLNLARKRARLTDSPTSSTSEAIQFEALPPEDVGTDFTNAIEIQDDDGMTMTSFDDADHGWPNREVDWALDTFSKTLRGTFFMLVQDFASISGWIAEHLEITEQQPRNIWLEKTTEHEVFFDRLARDIIRFLGRTDNFDPSEVDRELVENLTTFFHNVVRLCVRRIQILPDIMKEKLARRDSAQPLPATNGQQQVYGLVYIHLLSNLYRMNNMQTKYFRELRVPWKNIMEDTQQTFSEDGITLRALVSTLHDLCQGFREIKDAWTFIDSILRILRKMANHVGESANDVVEMVNETILPAICEKHPRALPEDFHALVVSGCRTHIGQLVGERTDSRMEFQEIYEQLIKGDNDALVGHEAEFEQVSDMVGQLDSETCVGLLRLAWTLQAQKRFLFSSIMDIRSLGIRLLVDDLCELIKWCNGSMERRKHTRIQYAARFLKQNALVSYIFSPDSHASLITHSADIVSYLAMTSAYSDTETDIIWQACTTSVEADFANASFAVLHQVCSQLECRQILHALGKYANTPVAAISSPAAVELLPSLWKCFHETLPTDDFDTTMAGFRVAFKLAQILHEAPPTAAADRLRSVIRTEISMYMQFPLDWRVQLYDCCIPPIIEANSLATVSIEILNNFLALGISSLEGDQLLVKLPMTSIIAEMRRHVGRAADRGSAGPTPQDIDIRSRLGVVARLLPFLKSDEIDSAQADLYRLLFGDLAMSNPARHMAWLELGGLTNSTPLVPAAGQLMVRYLNEFVPSMPTAFATPGLLEILKHNLSAACLMALSSSTGLDLLRLPQWKTLVRVAAEGLETVTADFAVKAVCYFMFDWPQNPTMKAAIASSHATFIRDLVNGLCTRFPDPSSVYAEQQVDEFKQAVNLLATVLRESKTKQLGTQLVDPMARVTLSSGQSTSNSLSFKLQLCLPQGTLTKTVLATGTSTVNDLVTALPELTGAENNRVIVGGKLVNLDADAQRTLSDLGVSSSGGITISPVYNGGLVLETVLTVSGPVEQEMMVQCDRLEPFLDGPTAMAQRIYVFLTEMRPSPSARARICSVEATAEQVFPTNSPCRAAFSAHVLKTNLADFARLGVADEPFIVHGIKLLAAVLMDDTPGIVPSVLLPVTACLGNFLRGDLRPLPVLVPSADESAERSTSAPSVPYFAQPSRFARRMIDRILGAEQLALDRLLVELYQVLLQAARVDLAVWHAFSQDSRFADLHATLFLTDMASISGSTMLAANSFCGEGADREDAISVYWDAITKSIPKALLKNYLTTGFFGLATELLARHKTLQASETDIRQLISTLLDYLRTHNHFESPECSLPDEATAGLLKLLIAAVTILKSYKKPLALEHTASEVFGSLLFPATGPPPRPLLHEETRGLAYDLIKAVCESPTDYRELAHLADLALSTIQGNPDDKFPGREDWVRPAEACAGLLNLGMTCYMNSLLQQLFANVALRKFLFDVPIVDEAKQVLLLRVRDLFARMQDDPAPYMNTVDLANTLGIQTDSQEDVHGFYATMLTRLEESMPDGKCKLAMSRFYTGKFISQVRGECGHVSSQAEAFTDVSITVKNKAGLRESLDEFVQGEPMQGANKYRCQSCDIEDGGRLVNAMKRTCLDETPDNITFCLKRFTFEAMMGLEGKVNDRFDFPTEIDMARYQRQHLESPEAEIQPDIFDLVGVIVHQGSLEFGHYWSHVQLANAAKPAIWVSLEDRRARLCQGVREVQEACRGGSFFPNGIEKSDNAYVLFYRRRTHSNSTQSLLKRVRAPPTALTRLPPRVALPAALEETTVSSCYWRWKFDHLFSSRFSTFMDWLISDCPAPTVDAEDSRDLVGSTAPDLLGSLASAAARYMLRLLLTDPASGKKSPTFLQALTLPQIDTADRNLFDHNFIQAVVDDTHYLSGLWRSTNYVYRNGVSEMLRERLVKLKAEEDPRYEDVLRNIVSAHALQLKNLGAIADRWHAYFEFAACIAKLGVAETQILLNAGYLRCVWEVVYVDSMDFETKKRYEPIYGRASHGNLDLTPLFALLYEVLRHVRFDDQDPSNDARYRVTDGMLLLKQHDFNQLHRGPIVNNKIQSSALVNIASMRCSMRSDLDWAQYVPGQLFALLIDNSGEELLRLFEKTLVARFRDEQYQLLPLLGLAFHYCRVKGDDSREVFVQIGKEMFAWKGLHGQDIAIFYGAIADLSCVAAIESSLQWVPGFLQFKKLLARRATMDYLAKHVFIDPRAIAPGSTIRLRFARSLSAKILPLLVHAWQQGHVAAFLQDMMTVMRGILTWLGTLLQDIQVVLGDEEKKKAANLSPGLLIEYDEARGTLTDLRQAMMELREWEGVAEAESPSLPTARVTEASASPELDVDEDGDSSGYSDEADADGDFDDYDNK
ncbi:hypothetical protein LTR97_000611 [Elasticomyces elasticus]|uniref:USP domain-containing protein n=1 Tax=Elasticomyces elasticus TaxID=574655 RepID=A0AAN7WDL7_9PEZI|nr:hypothetical protein LTR97_000611 [Elasticomyces elasticus]